MREAASPALTAMAFPRWAPCPFRGWVSPSVLFLAALLWLVAAHAQQLGPKVVATADQIAAAIATSPLSAGLKPYAADIGRLGLFESGGNLGVYNGTCCTGVLQVNRRGLRVFCGCTPAEYAAMPLQDQVNVWAKLTNANAANGIVQGLMARGTFDGKPVDGAMVLSCIQIGPGNCARTLAAGTCATRAGADGNGNNFCHFAAQIRSTDPVAADSGTGTVPTTDPSTSPGWGGAVGTYWTPVSAEDAFFNGAGVDMSEVNTFVSNLVGGAAILWAAWVSQAQFFLWRQGRIQLLALQTNILTAAVLTLLVLFFTLG
jgi:integrating conjugative element protein (TIGR03758 family)